jgi:streptogramin lyase
MMPSSPRRAGRWALLLALLVSAPVVLAAAIPSPEWIGIYNVQGQAGLLWIRQPKVVGYKILKRKAGERNYTLLTITENNRFNDPGVVPGETYVYRLVAMGSGGKESPPSQEQSFSLGTTTQVVLIPPRLDGYLVGERGISIRWTQKDADQAAAWNVYRSEPPDTALELLGSAREETFTDHRVEAGRTYRYQVTAVDASFKETPPSNPLEAVFTPRETKRVEKAPWNAWTPRPTTLVRIISGGGGKGPPLRAPADLAVAGDGRVFVADSGNGLVQVFNKDGAYLYHFSVPPESPGGRSYPLGIHLDRQGRILVTDAWEGRVVAFSPGGAVQGVARLPVQPQERKGNEPADRYPRESHPGLLDLCDDPGGKIFVIDNYLGRIGLLDSALQFQGYVGRQGIAPGELTFPGYCAVDAGGHLLVSEALLGRVQFFNADGSLHRAFGRSGKTVGSLARPKGLALDGQGRIYVADSWTCQIQVFDPEGRFLFLLADAEGKPLDLGAPHGIWMEDDLIYIAERLANRVQVRRIL